MSLRTPVPPDEVRVRLRDERHPRGRVRLRPGEEVAFLGPGYTRIRAYVRVDPEGAGSVVTGTLRFGRLERLSVLFGAAWFVLVTVRLLLTLATDPGVVPLVALVLIWLLGAASVLARHKMRGRMRAYLTEKLVAPAR